MSAVPSTVVVHQALAAVWPRSMLREELAQRAGLSAGQVRGALNRLSAQRLVEPCASGRRFGAYAWRLAR